MAKHRWERDLTSYLVAVRMWSCGRARHHTVTQARNCPEIDPHPGQREAGHRLD